MPVTIKAARINVGLNQWNAAKLLGVSPDTLSRYERGLSFPDVTTVQKMEKLYGIPYNELLFLPKNYDLNVK